jgi:hypothetical protein
MPPLLIIDWRGANWDLLDPMLAQGELPTIGRLLEQGLRASVTETRDVDVATPWWCSLAGVDPSHGMVTVAARRTVQGEVASVTELLGPDTVTRDNLIQSIRQRVPTAMALLAGAPCACLTVSFDQYLLAGQHFWRYYDRNSPLFVDGPYRAIPDVIQELDRATGEIIDALPNDTTVLVASACGMVGVSNQQIYLRRWLREQGFPELQVTVATSMTLLDCVPGERQEELLQKLTDWRHPETGAPIVARAMLRDEPLAGTTLRSEREIVVEWAQHRGYVYTIDDDDDRSSGPWLERVELKLSAMLGGDGMLVARGPNIHFAGMLAPVDINDLASTIRESLGIPQLPNSGGRVIREILGQADSPQALPDDKRLEERLRSLGYIE